MMKSPIQAVRRWVDNPSLSPLAIKGIIVAAAAAALVAPLALVAMPYIEFFNDMAVQDKVKPQMVWKYVDGRPAAFDWPFPRETIPREEYPYPFTDKDPKAGDRAVAWLTKDNPPPPPDYRAPKLTLALLRRGEKVFRDICIVCHGEYAFGTGSITRLGFPAPPSLHTPTARAFPLERIFHIATVGQNVMPSYAYQIPAEDRWAAAGYIKVLQRAFHPSGREETPAPPQSPPPKEEGAPDKPADPDGEGP